MQIKNHDDKQLLKNIKPMLGYIYFFEGRDTSILFNNLIETGKLNEMEYNFIINEFK